MGGKLGKAHNTCGEAGGKQGSGEDSERRHSDSDLDYSGGP